MKAIAELSIIPIGVGTSFSEQIAMCEHILKADELKIQLHSEGTNIEGELDKVLASVKKCLETLHDKGVPRLIANIKISTRTDKSQTMDDKIKSVESKM